jgi:hypothetical protein
VDVSPALGTVEEWTLRNDTSEQRRRVSPDLVSAGSVGPGAATDSNLVTRPGRALIQKYIR